MGCGGLLRSIVRDEQNRQNDHVTLHYTHCAAGCGIAVCCSCALTTVGTDSTLVPLSQTT